MHEVVDVVAAMRLRRQQGRVRRRRQAGGLALGEKRIANCA
jgi:hypothetical protein